MGIRHPYESINGGLYLERISALFITLVLILGSIGAANATVGGNDTIQNASNKNVVTQSVVNKTGTNWTSNNYDPSMSRDSPQTTISASNVNQLILKWKFNTGKVVENPPLIVGNTCYIQNNIMQVFALNLLNGQKIWEYDPHVAAFQAAHGIFYKNGIIYAPTGTNGTVIALNATKGSLIWKSSLINNQTNYYNPSPPIIWNNYMVVGGGGGDTPALKGSVDGYNLTNGKRIWHLDTCVGTWVQGSNASVNGGGAVWTGGAVDQGNGIVYLPVGNPSPDYNASTRNGSSKYTNDMIAVNITNGHVIWATPFIQVGTVLNVTLPDTHDYDTSWGSLLVTVSTTNGTNKLVIGHNKHGDIIAMNSTNGKPIWWTNLAYMFSKGAISHIWGYSATDNKTLYLQDSSSTGTGAIAAIDLLTGKLKWNITTNSLTTSPLISNGILFSGNVTTNLTTGVTSGIILALNKSSGNLLWQYNIGGKIGQGGPSIGQGMLLVPTGGGYVLAFGLNNTPITSAGLIKPANPINPTDPTNSTNKSSNIAGVNTSIGIKDIATTTNNNTSNTTIPMRDTGAPIVPLALAISSLIAGLAAIKRK